MQHPSNKPAHTIASAEGLGRNIQTLLNMGVALGSVFADLYEWSENTDNPTIANANTFLFGLIAEVRNLQLEEQVA